MTEYTINMFDLSKIRETHRPLFMIQESLEFKLNIFQTQFDSIRQTHYSELLVYERMKEHDPTLLPNSKVINQIRSLSGDPSVKEFRQTIVQLKREIHNNQTHIDNEIIKLEHLFSFKDRSLIEYVNQLDGYFKATLSFDELMKTIFTNEFYNVDLYMELMECNNMAVVRLLISRVPVEWKPLMEILIEELEYLRVIKGMDGNDEAIHLYITDEYENRSQRIEYVTHKLARIKYLNTRATEINNDGTIFNNPKEAASEFARERNGRHKEILKANRDAAIANGDRVSMAADYMKDPANSPTQAHGSWGFPKRIRL